MKLASRMAGGGTRFWFELDFGRLAQPGPVAKGVAEEERKETVPRHILVAEDNAINRKVIARILESAGHRVDLVEDGEEALDALYRRTYDLAIMDLQMPRMGGLQAVRRYLDGGDSVPFIVLTANATPMRCGSALMPAYGLASRNRSKHVICSR